jgi:uncharacterized membrane protein
MRACPNCKEEIKGKAQFCPSCGEKVGKKSSREKKSRLTEEKKSKKTPFLAVGALVVAGVVAVAAFALFRAPSNTVGAGSAKAGNTEISFDLATFNDGRAKYYSYDTSGGKKVKFFVLKSSDGVVRAAFDACDVCYQSKKGYRQEGNFMVCNNCGQRFISTKINEIRGGCNPAPLERKVAGDKLVIAVADILTGSWYF